MYDLKVDIAKQKYDLKIVTTNKGNNKITELRTIFKCEGDKNFKSGEMTETYRAEAYNVVLEYTKHKVNEQSAVFLILFKFLYTFFMIATFIIYPTEILSLG
jgi:hypothetical protein